MWLEKGGVVMSRKGFRHEYVMKSIYPEEMEEAIFTYMQHGWKHLDDEDTFQKGKPIRLVFEWQKDGPPFIPKVNWPPP